MNTMSAFVLNLKHSLVQATTPKGFIRIDLYILVDSFQLKFHTHTKEKKAH